MQIIFNGSKAKIYGTSKELDTQISEALSYEPEGAKFANFGSKFIYSAKAGKMVYNKRYIPGWDPRVKLYDKRSKEFPSGLIDKVLEMVPGCALQPESQLFEMSQDICIKTLRPYQAEAATALLSNLRGMAELPTAAGKTVLVSELCLRNKEIKILVTVPSLDLLYQTAAELHTFTGEDVGIYGDGEKDVEHRITVATIQSLISDIGLDKRTKKLLYDPADGVIQQRLKWLNLIKMWIVDECHGAAAQSYKIVSTLMPNAYRRYGVTATMRREDGTELVMEGVLGPCRIVITPIQLIEAGFLCKPRVELHRLQHPNYRVRGVKPSFADLYNEAVVQNKERTKYIATQVRKSLKEKKGPVLVLFDRLEHGRLLYKELSKVSRGCMLISGETKAEKRAEVKAKLESGEVDLVIASVIWVTGINIRRLRTVIVAGAGRSGIQTVQRAGRVLRTHDSKNEAYIIDICDIESCYLEDQVVARRFYYNEKYPGHVIEVEV